MSNSEGLLSRVTLLGMPREAMEMSLKALESIPSTWVGFKVAAFALAGMQVRLKVSFRALLRY